jgi:transcriptional regulator of nitric oxide reductase
MSADAVIHKAWPMDFHSRPVKGWSPASVILVIALAMACTGAAASDLSPATRFFPASVPTTLEQVASEPRHAILRSAAGRLLGYAFSTREVSGSVGYSGRPLDIVAAVRPDGIIVGAVIVAHEEPILVIGIPREAVAAYVANFKGFDVLRGSLQRLAGGIARGPHAVAGASVTSAVIRDAIVRSARAVLRAHAPPPQATAKRRVDRDALRRASWPALVADGSLRRLTISRGEAARLLERSDAEPSQPYLDLWLALATPPAIGESLVGKRIYESELAKLGPDDDLVFIAASGLYSFKGTEWRRSGTFDRIELVQGEKTIRFQAGDHLRIDALAAPGSPDLREIALFHVAHTTGFDAAAPFRLDIALVRDVPTVTPPPIVSLDYRIPDRYLVGLPGAGGSSTALPADDHAQAQTGDSGQETAAALLQAPLWQEIWWARRFEIAGLALMLGALAAILIFQNAVAAKGLLYERLRVAFLVVTLGFLGFIANAQLSVVNVVTFLHALLSGFRWELFLLDPMVFILWSFVAVSMLFWGRGVFCGWLCPFGALQELLNNAARTLGVKQLVIPFGLHERLWMIKYIIFLGILAVSLSSIIAAFGLAEVEPFKTAITMKFLREWPFVVYAAALLAAGLFVERFFCRYLCPLGGALAIPARMRMFEWLKRYRECGAECQICAVKCTVQAIHPLGQINPNECIYCLRCQANYFNGAVCLQLKKRAERRRPRTAETMSAVTIPAPDKGGEIAR